MQSKLLTEFLECFIMLLCKYFRRCHDGRLISILCAPRHCQKSQNRFTGTHVSLNQTLHGIRSLHIFHHIMQCSSLCSRQFIRKLLNQFFHELRMFHHKPVFLSGSLFFLVLHAHDKQKELIKNQPLSRLDQTFHRIRKVDLFDRIIILTQFPARTNFSRKKIRKQFFRIQCLPHRFYHEIVGDPACQRIHRKKTVFNFLIGLRRIHHRLFHHKFAILNVDISVKNKIFAMCQCIPYIRHPIPDQLDLMSRASNHKKCHLHMSSTSRYRCTLNPCNNRKLILCLHMFRCHLIDRHRMGILYIISGKMKEYITYGVYSHFFE